MSRTGRWRRLALFLGLNALGLVMVATLLVAPAYTYLSRRQAEIDFKFSRLARARAVLTHNAAMTERSQARLADVTSRFIRGDSPSTMNADLLTRLRQIAEARGIVFTSFASLPPRDWSGRQLVGARVEFSGLSRVVSDILADIEAGKGLLFIEKAHFTAARMDEADDTVSISLDVYGATG